MLKSLLKGLSTGAGMGIGHELTGTLIQHFKGRGQDNAAPAAAPFTPAASSRDIQCGRCGDINTGDSKFCGACGNQLVHLCRLSSGVQCVCGFVNAPASVFAQNVATT